MDTDNPLPDLDNAIEAAAVLRAVQREGLLDQFIKQPLSTADVARLIGGSDRFSWALVCYLNHLGVIRPVAGSDLYEAAPRAASLARRLAKWDHLASLLRNEPAPLQLDLADQAMQHYPSRLAEMAAIGRDCGSRLEALLPHGTTEPLQILEPGGGAGTWSTPLVAAAPARTAVVVDLPEVVAAARELHQPNRIVFTSGDMFRTTWSDVLPDNQCDVVILGNVLHLFDEQQNQQLLQRSAHVLRNNGVLIVLDVFPDRKPTFWASRYGLSLALRTTAGGLPTTSEVETWAASAGLVTTAEPLDISDRPPLTALAFGRPSVA